MSYHPKFGCEFSSFVEKAQIDAGFYSTWRQNMHSWCSMNCFRGMLKKYRALNSIPSSALPYNSSSTPNVLEKGHVLRLSSMFSELEVENYSKLTLDFNPLHFDSKFAKDAGFSHPLVPGMLVASVFPRIIASHFVSSSFVIIFSLFPTITRPPICIFGNAARSCVHFTKFAV